MHQRQGQQISSALSFHRMIVWLAVVDTSVHCITVFTFWKLSCHDNNITGTPGNHVTCWASTSASINCFTVGEMTWNLLTIQCCTHFLQTNCSAWCAIFHGYDGDESSLTMKCRIYTDQWDSSFQGFRKIRWLSIHYAERSVCTTYMSISSCISSVQIFVSKKTTGNWDHYSHM